MPRIVPLSLVLLISLGLSACGKRGPLEPPPGQTTAREAAKADAKAADAKAKAKADATTPGEGEGAGAATTKLGSKKRVPITAPKRDLFIDRLLD